MISGDVIRLVFPIRPDQGRKGRTIIGRVAHSSAGLAGCTIGVEFGWHAATAGTSTVHRVDPPERPLLGLLSRLVFRRTADGLRNR
jgi:hypothetical protein